MNSLEYLSGFAIGHILQKAFTEDEIDTYTITRYLDDRYQSLWLRYFKENDFYDGVCVGMKLAEIPYLTDDICHWFNTFVLSLQFMNAPARMHPVVEI